MRALIAVASKHGSTREIGDWVAEPLRDAGIDVEVRDAAQAGPTEPYDAVIVGSAVYMGRWMGEARDFVHRSAESLRARAVWLFSSGPLGDIVDPADAAEGLKLQELVGGRDHRVFPGKADRGDMGLGERTILRMVKQPYGDHRDRSTVRAWAESIAAELSAAPAGGR